MHGAEAELAMEKAKLELAEATWQRSKEFAKSGPVAPGEFEAAKAKFKVTQAAVAMVEAGLAQSRAALKLDEINLGYTTIKSPIKGVIIDRRMNVGQAIASVNSPSLFLIAKDLRNMQVWASINETDIGRIREGMKVRFTVAAFPRDVFTGTVTQIRLNATMTQNVVTYTVVVAFKNPDLKLLPYLTANLQFEM